MIHQGEIYLVDFAKKYNSEFGKVRPAVILQNDFLNRANSESIYQSVLVVPLTTQATEDDYKMPLEAREKLKENSWVVANWICTLDVNRVQKDKGCLTTLTQDELAILKQKVCSLI